MAEFWESHFKEKNEMWGFEPARSAVITKDFFAGQAVQNVLIPGIGYGRNARIFAEAGMSVTGIEVSETAIALAAKHYGTGMTIYHGSVTDMPFDNTLYDGIFCHALIHLLDSREREKLIRDCFNQLTENGYMFFSAISKEAHTYGQGRELGKDRFELFGGISMFFYDKASIHSEFEQTGLFEIKEITDTYPFFLIKCRKNSF